jgi:predicted RND superfamily exporter protein
LERLLAAAAACQRRPHVALAACLALTIAAGSGMSRLRIRTDGAAIHPLGADVVRRTEEDGALFRDAREVVVLVTPAPGSGTSLRSSAGLEFLRRAHADLAELQGLHPAGVFSLVTIPDGLPEQINLPFPTILDDVPPDGPELEALLRKIDAEPIANGLFLSRDGEAAALYVNFDASRPPADIVREIESWIAEQDQRDWRLAALGPLVAETVLGEKVLEDLRRLVPVMVAVIAILLFAFLRSPGGVIVPLAEAVLVLVVTLGAMGIAGRPVTLVTTILPVLLLAMGITDEIHVLERLQARLAAEPADDARAATLGALRDVGRPIVETSLTTSAAFLSFLSARLEPLRDFGLFASIGILVAMLLTFTFVPAFAAILPRGWFRPRPAAPPSALALERLVARGGRGPWIVALVVLALGVLGARRLRVEDAWVRNVDSKSELAGADREFNARFWGTYRTDIVLQADHWYFVTPDATRLAEEIRSAAENAPGVSGTFSYLTLLEQVADEFEKPLPVSALEEQDIRRLAFGAHVALGDPLLGLVFTPDASAVRLRAFVQDADYRKGAALEEHLEARLPELVGDRPVTFHLGGDLPIAVEVVRSIVTNQLRSLGLTALGVGLLLVLATRSLAAGAALLAPVLAADWLLLAALGALGVPLGVATGMFASLTIGVGVDYGIHLFHAYRSRVRKGDGHDAALGGALASSGRAIRWNALTLGLGFLVLGFSSLPPNRALGLLLAAGMMASWATTLVFLPRLLPKVAR